MRTINHTFGIVSIPFHSHWLSYLEDEYLLITRRSFATSNQWRKSRKKEGHCCSKCHCTDSDWPSLLGTCCKTIIVRSGSLHDLSCVFGRTRFDLSIYKRYVCILSMFGWHCWGRCSNQNYQLFSFAIWFRCVLMKPIYKRLSTNASWIQCIFISFDVCFYPIQPECC